MSFVRITQVCWGLLYRTGLVRVLSDENFTKMLYWFYVGHRLDLRRPADLNQKIQWLKLFWHHPSMPKCVDKYEVRQIVKERIGERYLADFIGVYERVEDVDFDSLPKKFVLKATHASGWNIICQDKSRLNWDAACRKMRRWLKGDFSVVGREWQYHEIRPRIICERFIEELETGDFMDYRLFAFQGEVKYILVEFGRPDDGKWHLEYEKVGGNKPNRRRGITHYTNFYTREWEYLPNVIVGKAKTNARYVGRPICLDEMIDAAHKLSAEFPFCRVDFYVIGGKKAVFSELTFTPGKGCYMFKPEEFGVTLGNCMTLPDRKIK